MKKTITVIAIFILLGIITITFGFYACTKKENNIDDNNLITNNQSDNIGNNNFQQIENNSTPTVSNNFIAPFVDMVSWIDPSNEYSINGVPNLAKFAEDTNIYTYNLGFIQLNQSNPVNETDGTPRWGWGGYYDMSERGNDGYQYEGIKQSIQSLKNIGGEIIVSFGGQLGSAPWTVTQNLDTLKQMYYEVIKAYGLKRIDLDIEESNQDSNNNYQNALALKEVQDSTGIAIHLTIPIMPYGWEQKQINLINAYLSAGLKIDIINSMTMCYYNLGLENREDYADASIRALKNAKTQIQNIYLNYGNILTDEQAYQKLGATMAIGYEYGNPIWSEQLTLKLANFGKDNNLKMMSFWNMERDSGIENNSGIVKQYEHINTLKNYKS